MADTKVQIGARLKALRKGAGLTQEQLAEIVDLDARHLSRLEVGRHFPTLETLERIAGALDVPLVEFFRFPEMETTRALRAFLTNFAKRANDAQLRMAVKAVKLATEQE